MEGNCVRKGRNGRKLCKERAEWKKITEKLKPTMGCNGRRRRRGR
jgi:hypothetical protein